MGTTGMMMPIPKVPLDEAVKNGKNTPDAKAEGDPHLRSATKAQSYTIYALDDTIGDAEDFIVDDSNWVIHCMVVSWQEGNYIA